MFVILDQPFVIPDVIGDPWPLDSRLQPALDLIGGGNDGWLSSPWLMRPASRLSISSASSSESPEFIEWAAKVWGDAERIEFIDWIAENALAGDVIPGAGSLRKVRWLHGPWIPGRGRE